MRRISGREDSGLELDPLRHGKWYVKLSLSMHVRVCVYVETDGNLMGFGAATGRSFLQVAVTEEVAVPPLRVVQIEGLVMRFSSTIILSIRVLV